MPNTFQLRTVCFLLVSGFCSFQSFAQIIRLTHYPNYILCKTSYWHKADTINRLDSLHRKQGFWILYDSSYKAAPLFHPKDNIQFHVQWSGSYSNGLRQGIWKNTYYFSKNRVEYVYVNHRLRYPVLEYRNRKIVRSILYDSSSKKFKASYLDSNGKIYKTEFLDSFPLLSDAF